MSPVRPEVMVIGRRLAAEDHQLRDFLTRSAQPFTWLDAETPEAQELLGLHRASGAALPVVIEQDATVIASASPRKLAEAWRMTDAPQRSDYDLVIVGAGPAGLAAAVYAASDGLSTLVVERDLPGGQASHTSLIENFFGFPEGIGGAELARLAGRQAERFGAELVLLGGVTSTSHGPDGPFAVEIAGGHHVTARTMIAAPGMDWRRMEFDGLDALLGRGVYYGAGRSEAAQCGGDPVVVVGAGNSAGQAVMNLGNAGAKVTMLVRGNSLAKSMSAYLIQRIQAHPLVQVHLSTELTGLHADDSGDLAAVATTAGELDARALFLCLGGVPRTGWATDHAIGTDAGGFLLTGPDLLTDGRRPERWPLARDPLALETSVPGLFAAGDARSGSTKRVAGAVGEGAMACALVHRRLDELQQTLPTPPGL
ncbi:MAG: pyridine nucleotide-disulfide oxidoreductase [Solirubrobacterales bacterium]|nr:pyridine nucleotide-disulfide oxidoreductase [Solirubrobacterales bacterium]